MNEQQPHHEKEEKPIDEKSEKEVLKHDEKVEQQDQLSTITWSFMLIWAGAAVLAINLGWFDALLDCRFCTRILPENMAMFEPSAWSIIMAGAGVILLAVALVRILMPQFHRNIGGTLLLAAVFIGVGLGNFFGWDLVWPIVLIAVGAGVLIGGLGRSRK